MDYEWKERRVPASDNEWNVNIFFIKIDLKKKKKFWGKGDDLGDTYRPFSP